MEVRMALVARMTTEPVTSMGMQAAGMRASSWTTGQFAMWDWPMLGKVVEWWLERLLGFTSTRLCSNVANSRAVGVGMCVSSY